MGEVVSPAIGDRLRLTYPGYLIGYGREDEVFEVMVTRLYDEDGAFDVDLIEDTPGWTDWTVFQDEIRNGTVVIEKLS